MIDKRITEAEVVAELRDGMTLGIGGWGSRRKPMSLVRAILRSALKDLTVVSYGGPDVGLLCAAGKVKKLVYGFVSLDSIPLEPYFRAARQSGAIEAVELDEGMLQWGLYAASLRLPFLPTRAGLGSDLMRANPALRTVRSPYEDGEELVAVPAIPLDAALFHMNRADAAGNGQYLGDDPYFDPLFCHGGQAPLHVRRADRPHRRLRLPGPEADPLHQPHDDRRRGRGPARRPLHRLRAGLRPRRALPARVRRGRGRSGGVSRLQGRSTSTSTATTTTARRWPEACDERLHARTRSARSPAPKPSAATARSSRAPSASSPPSAPAWRGPRSRPISSSPTARPAWSPASPPSVPGTSLHVEGWMPYRAIFDLVWSGRRHVMMGASQIDRYGNQNIACIGPFEQPKAQLLGVRGAPGNTINHRDQLLDPQPHSPLASWPRSISSPASATTAPARSAPRRRASTTSAASSRNKGVFDFDTADRSMRLRSVHPGGHGRRRREEHRIPAQGPRSPRGDARADRGRAAPPPRGDRSDRRSARRSSADDGGPRTRASAISSASATPSCRPAWAGSRARGSPPPRARPAGSASSPRRR